MTNEQILKKALDKAMENSKNYKIDDSEDRVIAIEIRGILFDPSFAKAFWGKEKIHLDSCKLGCDSYCDVEHNNCENFVYGWKWHLQQMVLEKEPLKYIKKFL